MALSPAPSRSEGARKSCPLRCRGQWRWAVQRGPAPRCVSRVHSPKTCRVGGQFLPCVHGQTPWERTIGDGDASRGTPMPCMPVCAGSPAPPGRHVISIALGQASKIPACCGNASLVPGLLVLLPYSPRDTDSGGRSQRHAAQPQRGTCLGARRDTCPTAWGIWRQPPGYMRPSRACARNIAMANSSLTAILRAICRLFSGSVPDSEVFSLSIAIQALETQDH